MIDNMSKNKLNTNQNLVLSLVFIINLLFFLKTKLWLSFCDEADNFVGGWLISEGYILYSDMFSHHMPFTYYYTSLLINLGLNDVSDLRLGMALTIAFFWIIIIIIFKDRIDYKIISAMMLLSGITRPFYVGHMVLADSFFGYSTLIIFLYFFSEPDMNFKIWDKIIISLMIYISIMSTLVSIYPIMLFGAYYIFKKKLIYSIVEYDTKKIISEIKFALLISVPFLFFMIYLLKNNSLHNFYNQAYIFNKLYYSQFTGTLTTLQFIDPMKSYGEHIFYYISNIGWLINENTFVWEPIGHTPLFFEGFLVISNLIALMIFWKTKNLYIAIFYFILLGFLRIRGGCFHGTPYYLLSFFSVSLTLTEIYNYCDYNIRNSCKLKTGIKICFIFIIFYFSLMIVFLGMTSYVYASNYYGIGSSDAYDSPYDIIVQTLTQPDDTIWVAPLTPSLYFSNKRLPASRYTFYLPWNAASDKINEKLIEDLTEKKPLIIIFNRDAAIWGYLVKDYGNVIDEYISNYYYQVEPHHPIYKNVYLINTHKNQLLKTLYDNEIYKPLDSIQLDSSTIVGEIIAGDKVIQTYTPLNRGVNRIDLMLATFARVNHGRLVFHLKSNLTDFDDEYNITENISSIKDNSWYTISFPELNDSLIGKKIYFIIEAPDSKPGDAITIYSSKNDTYKMGDLYINDQLTGKDLTFRTYRNL